MWHTSHQMANKDAENKREYEKKYYEQNKEKIKQYYEQNKDDIAEKVKKYQEKNKDKIAKKKKKYYEQNKDEVAEKMKKYYEQNKDDIAEKMKKYQEQNKDKIAKKKKKYYEQNKDEVAEKMKKYYEQNKEKIKQYFVQNKDDIAEKMRKYNLDRYKCNTEHCSTMASQPKYKGYCFRCFIHTYPNEEVPRNYKVKERHVQDYLTEHFKDAFTYDKVISGGCSRFRPDWLCDMLTHSIIVECDENQHQDYSCENKRMMTLFVDLGHRPIVFIRFNPDGYIDDDKKRHNSCFKYHQQLGTPIIANQKEWSNRLCALKETIQYHMDNVPTKEVHLEHLFYS